MNPRTRPAADPKADPRADLKVGPKAAANANPLADPHADPLDDVLDDLRVCGSVLLHERYAAPWAIEVPDEAQLRQLLGVDTHTRVLLFHFVRRGGFELHLRGQRPLPIGAADVAICAAGSAHRMAAGRAPAAVPLDAILRGHGPPAPPPGAGDVTELMCGVFLARAAPLNPMLGALPAVLRVATGDAASSPMLAGVAWMLAHELERGALGGFTAARLLEVFFAEAVRAHQRQAGAGQAGWLKALADPRIGQAIRLVHATPGQDWSVSTLATQVALSPSRFAARFRAATGCSVMAYVARWRANVACRMLRDGRQPLTDIATRIGYDSLPAFSRAFKAHVGQAPAAWRQAQARPHAVAPPSPAPGLPGPFGRPASAVNHPAAGPSRR